MNTAVNHYENFPVASVLIPVRYRKPIIAVYWFARGADDVADEGSASTEERLAGLQQYRRALEQIAAANESPGERFDSLARALKQHALLPHALTDLHHLLDAFEQDAAFKPMQSPQDLLAYCTLSANPVGRLVLRIFGLHDEAILPASDAICSSLQLINFLQDVKIDASRGRIYMPIQTLSQHRISEVEWLSALSSQTPVHQAAFAVILKTEWARADALLMKGAPLVGQLRSRGEYRLALEIAATVQGGRAILTKIANAGFNPFAPRPKLGKLDWITLAFKSLLAVIFPTKP